MSCAKAEHQLSEREGLDSRSEARGDVRAVAAIIAAGLDVQ
jgi:hypothetical protein